MHAASLPVAILAIAMPRPAVLAQGSGAGVSSELQTADAPPAPRIVTVDRDDVEVRESCILSFPKPVADAAGDGVVRIVADGITVDLGGGVLDSGLLAGPDAGPDGGADSFALERCAGRGIVVAAKGVTLRNGSVRGFKVGVEGTSCDRSTFERLDLSDNHAQPLKSTKEAEDAADWLYPHENDRGEQIDAHGAGLSISNARDVVVREVRVRRTQNGIALSSVHRSQFYDNDCSFLSGWGLSMWRSSDNTICRNAFDFCIRGYSHGVYNRGQDSAGILMFEQCSRNVVALNSATHCGDGVFGFAGREALGEKPCPSSRIDFDAEGRGTQEAWYRGRGCNGNLFALNDLSYAAAHGFEMTFSFENAVIANRLVENGINGVWFGYARDSVVAGNEFERNAAGDIAAEHAQRVRVERNAFRGSRTGVAFWDDEDPGLAKLPWTGANGSACEGNVVVDNTFESTGVAILLRAARKSVAARNAFEKCVHDVEATEGNPPAETESARPAAAPGAEFAARLAALDELPGKSRPVGARAWLRGRDKIEMGVYGPREPKPEPQPAGSGEGDGAKEARKR